MTEETTTAATEEVVCNVAKDLESLLVDVQLIIEDPNNENVHSPDQIKYLTEAYATVGMQKPISAQPQENGLFMVKAGHAMLRAARVLGWTHVPLVRFDGTELEADVYRITDNTIGRMSEVDEKKMAATAVRLRDSIEDFDPAMLTIDEREMERLTALLQSEITESPPIPPGEEPPTTGEGTTTEEPGKGPGLGTPVVRYEIIFDNEQQQSEWFEFLKGLRSQYPDAETIGERISLYLKSDEPQPDSEDPSMAEGAVGREGWYVSFPDAPSFAQWTGMVDWLEKNYEEETFAGKVLALFRDATAE